MIHTPAVRRRLVALAVTAAGATACDDQVKHVAWFETMYRTPSIETYDEQPLAPVAGTVPVGTERHFDLLAADTMLSNPLAGTMGDPERGETLYLQYCIPCHGETGAGDGPVVGPNRLPPLPTLSLLSDRARDLSDGYIYGMIANGRGVMPAYRRVPHEDRWYLVEYVRSLQDAAPAATE